MSVSSAGATLELIEDSPTFGQTKGRDERDEEPRDEEDEAEEEA